MYESNFWGVGNAGARQGEYSSDLVPGVKERAGYDPIARTHDNFKHNTAAPSMHQHCHDDPWFCFTADASRLSHNRTFSVYTSAPGCILSRTNVV